MDPSHTVTASRYAATSHARGTTRIRSVKVGALTGACGTLKKQVKQFPFWGVRASEWRIFFSDTAVLDKQRDRWVRRTVVVPRSEATA